MTGWLFLSDRDAPVTGAPPAALDGGTLVVELSWPLPTGVLLDWQEEGQALSLFHHPASGLGLLWRDGPVLRRFLLTGALRSDCRLARLHLRWSRAEGTWAMRLDGGDETTIGSTYGLNPPDLSALLWFGVTSGEIPPRGTAWIGLSTPVPTIEGLVPAGLLQPGQWVLTRDAGPVRLRSLRRMDMPSRGSHAAVVLRAPFHARDRDLLVSADQLVAVGGLEAEYLFGEEEVLVSAGALVDGRSVLADNRRATTQGISLDLGQLHLIDVQGCILMTAHHGRVATRPILPLRALADYEAGPLMGLLRRLKPSDAA
ncbi:MAG: Hint domain-containing protein [Rhodobacteraceae bacterium]|nr:Hint domain-containing protein [Paracoccaceae bacterium]